MTTGNLSPNTPSESWLELNSGFLIKLAIFIILLIIVLASTGYLKKIFLYVNPDLESCKGGICKSSCIKGSELQQQNVNCSDTNNVCCMPDKHVQSPECLGRTKGTPCSEIMLCDEYLQCVSRCEYCSMNPDDISCEIKGSSGKFVTEFDSTFSCGCSEMDCINIESSKMGTCVKGFCPSNNPLATDFMCCSTLYEK